MLNFKISTMKTKFLMAAALVLAAACNQIQTLEEDKPANGNELVTVTVNISGGASTRATDIADKNESAISDIQLFAFNSDGSIDSYAKESTSKFTLKVTAGTKDFIALVNCPDLGTVGSKTELLATVSLLEKNASDHFEMVGELAEQTVNSDATLTITVKRIVSKVVIEKISTAFSSPYLADQEFKVTGIYLTNAVASCNYAVDAKENLVWVNKNGVDTKDNPAKALTQDTLDATVTASAPYVGEHRFYCYPNPVEEDSTAEKWSERFTRLVIETTLGGTVGYYSIKIPEVGRNKIYTIKELKVTRRGSKNPYEDITTADAEFSITVADWETGSTIENVTI